MYILEGNIGAGKSTFLKMLCKELSFISIGRETKNSWVTKVDGESLIANFYQTPKRWAYTLETLAMINRVAEHKTEQEKSYPFHIIERSIYSGYYCFAKNCYENGFLNEIEWNVYRQWYSFLTTDVCHIPQGFIYLRVDPDIAYERTKQRNRSEEKKITLGYLKQIHQHHESFLIDKISIHYEMVTTPVLVLDGNLDFEHNPEIFEKHCTAVEDFLIHTQPCAPIKGETPFKSPPLE